MVIEADGTDSAGGVAMFADFGAGGILTQQTAAGFLVYVHLSYLYVHYLDLVFFERLNDGK